MTTLTRFLIACVAALAVAMSAAADVVTLKDGKSYTGDIVEQNDDYLIIRVKVGSIEQTYTIWANNIDSVVRDGEGDSEAPARADSEVTNTTSVTRTSETPTTENIDPNRKRVFFIPMHGGVGEKFRQDKLELAVDAARRHKADIIVLEINSPGGLLSEVYELRDYLSDVRNEFRVVSWIKSAISAAAMTAINTREIYFMREGHMGAATAWYMAGGQAKAMEGPELEQWLKAAREMAEAAGHSGLVAQAMISKDYWLTADRKELPTGEVEITFYDSDQGEHTLSRPGEILTLTASEAERFGISLGTADNEAQLAEKLNLDSWVEVSDEGRKIMENWFSTVDRANEEIPKLLTKYNYLSQRGGSNREARRQMGELINILKALITWLKKDPAIEDLFPLDRRALERELENLKRQMGG